MLEHWENHRVDSDNEILSRKSCDVELEFEMNG